ncbi:SGNH/GDSL hydrolase family protein [uncultured Tateyamaria sp.]|uniref:SGNH/GDSL hydrolase family protein n=1 Tax=uncultured Tateyamaria sp. TaxID=455651 RepID=UPI002633AF76|nr:SGNH/GDSL hydrolase family protein [uncultured Tateyamaria sp.]
MTRSDVTRRFSLLRLIKWGGLVVVGGIYACLFGEVFLRLLDPQVRMPRYVTGTEYGIRGNIPNSVYRQSTPEVQVEVRINGQGMRNNQEFALEKPPGTCRIALLGDSYFMGYEAHYEDTIVGLLESRLAAMGYRVEVPNFAVSGFSTEEMLREFEERTVTFDPDVVIVQFGRGDFADNMRPGLYRLDEDGVPQPTGGSYLPGVDIRDTLMKSAFYRMLISDSHFYSAIREWAGKTVQNMLTSVGNMRRQVAAFRGKSDAAQSASSTEQKVQTVTPYMRQTRYTSDLLMLSRVRAEEEGMEWFMFEIPAKFYGRAYGSFAKDLDLDAATSARVISPMSLFDEYPEDADPWLYREQGHSHFTEAGNGLATQALIDGMFRTSPQVFEGCRSS